VLLTISNTMQNAIIGEDNTVTGGLLGAGTLLTVNPWSSGTFIIPMNDSTGCSKVIRKC